MKKYILVIALLLALASALPVSALVSKNVSISINFDEQVSILRYNLTDLPFTRTYNIVLVRNIDNKSFIYNTTSALSEGNYRFNIEYKDVLDNMQQNHTDFSITPCGDFDNDSYGLKSPQCTGDTDTDCNDSNASIYPGADEICGNGVDENCDGKDTACPPALSSIQITPKAQNITVGAQQTYKVEAFYSDGNGGFDVTGKSFFSSNSTSIASLSSATATAILAGSVKITANYTEAGITKNDFSVLNINALPVFSYEAKISPTEESIKVGEKKGYAVFTVELCTKTGAENLGCTRVSSYSLQSSKTEIVEVNNAEKWFSGKAEGYSNLTASIPTPDGKTAVSNIVNIYSYSNGTIEPVFYIVPTNPTVIKGKNVSFDAFIEEPGQPAENVTSATIFRSLNTAVLSPVLGRNNAFSASAVGESTIIAEYPSKSKSTSTVVYVVEQPFITMSIPKQFPDHMFYAYINKTTTALEIRTAEQSDSCAFSLELREDGALKLANRMGRDGSGTIYNYSLLNVQKEEILYVECNKSGAIKRAEFHIIPLTGKPKITNLTAKSVYDFPLESFISVETDQYSVCKYDNASTSYPPMTNTFNFENEYIYYGYKTSADAVLLNLINPKKYTYNVACKGLSGLISDTSTVSFVVDTTVPPNYTIVSPGSGCIPQDIFTFQIKANKVPEECYASSVNGGTDIEFMKNSGDATYLSTSPIGNEGTVKYYLLCRFFPGIDVKKTISVTTDTVPPVISAVDDSSDLADPEVTNSKTKLSVKVTANDTGCGIDHYEVQVFNDKTDEPVSDVYSYTSKSQYIIEDLELENNTKYYIHAKVVDKAGLTNEKDSNGITVDTSAKGSKCENNRKDSDESDVDCGGSCPKCAFNESCNTYLDCASGLCNLTTHTCGYYSCSDAIKNGNETDADCGGGNCTKCDIGKTCRISLDCKSSNCNNSTKKCEVKDSCSNKQKDGTETDVDCGGECNDCSEGKQCDDSGDCMPALSCSEEGFCIRTQENNTPEENVTPEPKDSDGDGMPDDWEDNNGLNKNDPSDAEKDNDNDGLTNKEEFDTHCTDPNKKDTDGDGFSDGEEVKKGTDPCDPESHPKKTNYLLIILLILLILAGGVWLYLYYTKSNKKKAGKKDLFHAPPQFGVNERNEQRSSFGPRPDFPGRKKEGISGIAGYPREISLSPEQIARLREKVRKQQRKDLFNKFDKQEGENERGEENEEKLKVPSKNKTEKEEEQPIETYDIENKELTGSKKKASDKKEEDAFKELERVSERLKSRDDAIEDVRKIAEKKKRTKGTKRIQKKKKK